MSLQIYRANPSRRLRHLGLPAEDLFRFVTSQETQSSYASLNEWRRETMRRGLDWR